MSVNCSSTKSTPREFKLSTNRFLWSNFGTKSIFFVRKTWGRYRIQLSVLIIYFNNPHKGSAMLNNNPSDFLLRMEQESRKFDKICSSPDTLIDNNHVLISIILIKLILSSLNSNLWSIFKNCLNFIEFMTGNIILIGSFFLYLFFICMLYVFLFNLLINRCSYLNYCIFC